MKTSWWWAIPTGVISFAIGFDARFWPSPDAVPVSSPRATANPDDLVQCRTYLLSDERWLTLNLPKNVVRLRLLTNAAFDPSARDTIQPGVRPVDFPLDIEYQVLDAEGGELLNGHSVFESRIYGTFDERQNRAVVGGFYKQSELLPSDSHELTLALDGFEGRAATVKVRMGTHAEKIREAVLRSYALVGRDEGFDEYLWDRTSPTWRERMTRTNLYPPELVSEAERQNLLRHRWMAVPPSGIDGTDYEERILCLLRHFRPPPEIEPVTIWHGYPVAPHWKGGISLPDPAGRVRLEFTWHEDTAKPADGTTFPAIVRWYEPRSDHVEIANAYPKDDASTVELNVAGGLLEIESPRLAEVRAWWKPVDQTLDDVLKAEGGLEAIDPERISPDGEIDITPDAVVRKAFRVEPEGPVEFSVSHLSDEATPLRVVLQELMAAGGETVPGVPKLTWEFLGEDGKVLYDGVIEHAAALSDYDRADERAPVQNVGEPATRYFSVPPEVAVARFRSDAHSILVSASTRPPDLPFVRVVGDDLDPLVEQETERAWFPLMPDGFIELAEQGRAQVVYIRRRPPERSDDDVDDRSRWDSFTPTTPWTARRVLVPWLPEPDTRPELLSIVYQQLQPRVEYSVHFAAAAGVRQVVPRLVWSDVPHVPQTLSVFIDGKLHEDVRILSPNGQAYLSPVPIEDGVSRRIEVRTDDVFPVYMSGLEPGVGPALLQRMALRWSSSELEFDYEKLSSGNELLQMQLFQTSAAGKGSEISCELIGAEQRQVGPFERWTLCRRIFQLQAAREAQALVLDAGGERVEDGRLCVIPLGPDLPPGRYRLRVRRESGDIGYVLLYRRTPDAAPRRVIEILSDVNPEVGP